MASAHEIREDTNGLRFRSVFEDRFVRCAQKWETGGMLVAYDCPKGRYWE